jgi:aromatic O-demethylase, cytochrome P450 subunit
MTSPVAISVTELDDDPYPFYAQLRAEQPVAYVPCVDTWFVTRYADVQFVAEHPALFPAEHGDSPQERTFGKPTIIAVDGAVHHELRRGFDGHFRPRRVESYIDALVRPIAERQADAIETTAPVELMAAYFEPVSVLSLGSVFGLGDLDADTLRHWFHGLNVGATNYERDPDKQRVADAITAEIDAVLIPRLRALARQPDDSTMSQLLHTGTEPGSPREIDFVLPSFKTAILGGMQEPGHAAGTVLAGMLGEPDQWQAVRDDPGLLADAVEEGLRWVAPIGTQLRTAADDIELAGAVIPAGASVSAVLASANRDDTVFADPDRFDLHRANKRQAAFGFGKHFCSGHSFARHQMRIGLEVLLERFPNLHPQPDTSVRFRGWEFRAPATLEVVLD